MQILYGKSNASEIYRKKVKKVIRKIIDMLSGAAIFVSTIAVIPLSICNPHGLPFCIWAIVIFLSGLWQLFRYQTDDGPLFKMPRPIGNSDQGQRKFYNIILTENEEKVNETV